MSALNDVLSEVPSPAFGRAGIFKFLSASKIGLLRHCKYFAREDVEYNEEAFSLDAATLGNAVHFVLEEFQRSDIYNLQEILLKAEKTFALTHEQTRKLRLAVEALLEFGRPSLALGEVAFAYDPKTKTARELGRNIDRKYIEHGLQPGEIAGTVDLVWMSGSDVVVYDLKTGMIATLEKHHDQLMTLLVAARRAYNGEAGRIGLIHVQSTDARESSEEKEDFEIEAYEDELLELTTIPEDAEPHPGPHCLDKFCPAIQVCPVSNRVAELMPVDRLTFKLTGPIESPGECAARIDVLPLLKKKVAEFEKQIKAYVDDHGPVQLPNGSGWGRKETEIRKLVPTTEAMDLLIDELGEEGARAAIDVQVTQAGIKRVIEDSGDRPVASKLARIVESLEKIPGVVTKTKRTDYEQLTPNQLSKELARVGKLARLPKAGG